MKGWEDNVNVDVWDVVDEGFMLDEHGERIKDTPITVKAPTSGNISSNYLGKGFFLFYLFLPFSN